MPRGSQEQNLGITSTKGLIDRYLTEKDTLAQPSNLTEDLEDSTSLVEQYTTSPVEFPLSGWLDQMCPCLLFMCVIFALKLVPSGTNTSNLRVLAYNIWGMPSMLADTRVNKSVRSLSSTLEPHLLQHQNHGCHLSMALSQSRLIRFYQVFCLC